MQNEKIVSGILKEAKDSMTINRIKMLWEHYKDDAKTFSSKLGETIRNNMLSLSRDKDWILKTLKSITGHEWQLSGHDFKFASNAIQSKDNIYKKAGDELLKKDPSYFLKRLLPLVQKIRIPKAKSFVRINSQHEDEYFKEVEAIEMIIPKIQLKRGFYNGTKFFIYADEHIIVVEEQDIGFEHFPKSEEGIKEAIEHLKEAITNLIEQAQNS